MPSLLDDPNSTIKRIYRYHEYKADNGFRDHLGASILGRECEREIWYSFRWFKKNSFTGRMLRLFETGQLQEARFIKELSAIGVEVHEINEETGKQFTVSAVDGHFGGSLDGCALGIPGSPKTWHVLEFKTHNDKSFSELLKNGVFVAKPEHYAQMQLYMGLTEMTRAMYLAVNKNTDELYQERVRFDKEMFDALLLKARRIIKATRPPLGISETETFYKCRMCPFNDVCHRGAEPERNCRTCKNASIVGDKWICRLTGSSLTRDEQLRGCDNWAKII